MSAGLVWRTIASRVGFKMGWCRPGRPSRAGTGPGKVGTLDTDPKAGDPPEGVGPAGKVAPRCFLPGWLGAGGVWLGAFCTNAGRPRWGRCHWRPGDDLLQGENRHRGWRRAPQGDVPEPSQEGPAGRALSGPGGPPRCAPQARLPGAAPS